MSKEHLNKVGQVYHRPWGTYKTLEMGGKFQAKIITVNPGGVLSLQKHFQRSEHWVVVEGVATITVDDTVKDCKVGEYAFIPIESVHRLENKTSQDASIIEVQVGDYLGEDDIVRLEDVYDR